MNSKMIISIVIFCFLLLMDMFFYGFSEAVRNLNKKELDEIASAKKDKRYILLQRIYEQPAEYINTLQVFATASSISIGIMYALVWLKQWGGLGLITVFPAMYILLSLGVLFPKRMAAKYPEQWALTFINPVYVLTVLFKPVTGFVGVSVKLLLLLFGMKEIKPDNEQIEEEIINMVYEGQEQGLIEDSEALMISNIFSYGDKEAQDIMTNRNYIVGLSADMTLSQAIDFMLAEKYSRFPVYQENYDHIVGILHMKDALRYQNEAGKSDCPISKLKNLYREPVFVTQTKKIDELFREMQKEKLHMVIVIDEYGQTDGLLAMEDILEEIVGNILDEYDDEKSYIRQRGTDQYLIDGTTPLEEIEQRFGIKFENEKFDTINGFLIARLDRIPEPDENFEVEYQGYNFKIAEVKHKMITSVQVTREKRNLDSSLEQ